MANNHPFEFIGYGVLSNLLRRTYKALSKPIGKLLRLADRMNFEQYKMSFGQRDSDIYIASYPKSGTTMMQMILYQLTTDGKMSFNHIYEVSPWIRNASFKKQSPPELSSPRLIKTHDYYKDFNKKTKGRFIYLYRNGMDVAVSMYHQQKNYNKSNLEFDDFIKNFFKTKSWFKHTRAWLNNKKKLTILYVRYEDLLANKEAEIQRVIDFCGLTPGKTAIERAIQKSRFEYMKKYQSKFGDQPEETKKVYDQFIRKGKAGEGKSRFSKDQKLLFNKTYERRLKDVEIKVFGLTH